MWKNHTCLSKRYEKTAGNVNVCYQIHVFTLLCSGVAWTSVRLMTFSPSLSSSGDFLKLKLSVLHTSTFVLWFRRTSDFDASIRLGTSCISDNFKGVWAVLASTRTECLPTSKQAILLYHFFRFEQWRWNNENLFCLFLWETHFVHNQRCWVSLPRFWFSSTQTYLLVKFGGKKVLISLVVFIKTLVYRWQISETITMSD